MRGDVQARAGSEKLGYRAPAPAWVRLEGYSLTGQLSVCDRRPGTIRAGGQPELSLACPGFENASSGGVGRRQPLPWPGMRYTTAPSAR